jgi:hypothetical protein
MSGIIQFKAPKSATPEYYSFPNGYAGGIDISQSADLISQNKSPDMCNANYDAGAVPCKRYGFDQINDTAYGTQDIRGLFEYEKSGSNPLLLLFCDGKLWAID